MTAYLRAFLIAAVTITLGTLVCLHVPEFMKGGWSQLIFENSGNIAPQPLETLIRLTLDECISSQEFLFA